MAFPPTRILPAAKLGARRLRWRSPLWLLLGLALAECSDLHAQFSEKAGPAGVDLNYPLVAGRHTDTSLDTYSVGSASAACDLDGDGWTDLIVARADAPCLVFINNRDGTFREESHLRGLDTASDIGGIAVGDFQNSGHPDVVMVPVSGPRQFFFANDGTGHFHEVAVERGADATVTAEAHRGQSVSLVDYDRDGYLDLYFSEWHVSSNNQNELHSALLHNRGRQAPGFFESKTSFAGVLQPARGNLSSGYMAAWADFDGDGYPDLFIAGDFGTSQLWWNNGDGTFSDGSGTSGIANSADGMGATLLDYDGDGKIDLFVSAVSLVNPSDGLNYVSDNKLFRNLGGRKFQEVSSTAGVRLSGWGWGAQSLDANNDGWPDLAVTNGYFSPLANFAPAKTDPTKLFINGAGTGTFSDQSTAYGVTDTGLGRSLVVLDYDNDGREDLFITQTEGHRLLYHNDRSSLNAHWLNLRFVGSTSNRNGIGCEVTVTAGGRDQFAVYNPSNAYLGQREPRLHFGLGASTSISKVSIKWPSGVVQELANPSADQTLTVTEPAAPPTSTAPVITAQPANLVALKDSPASLSVTAEGTPTPVYNWFKNGVRLTGQNESSLSFARLQPADAGTYTVTVTNLAGTVTSQSATVIIAADLPAKTVARWWNEALLDGIRKDTPNPPVHARNLFHLSATLWDAFWAYERDGWTMRHEVFDRETPALPAGETERLAAQREAMSYAAYTVIKQRFSRSPGATATTVGIRWLMQQLGYDPDYSVATGNSPAAVGLRIGQRVLDLTLNDGADEAHNYVDATGYHATNEPLVVRNSGVGSGIDPDRWQPLDLVNTVTQNGIVLGPSVQSFVGANAKSTRPFALVRAPSGYPADDPGAPPRFNSDARAEYTRQAIDVLLKSSQLTTADGVSIDISPGAQLNNPLSTNDGRGHPTNPVTHRPYSANVVLRGDYGRVLAEFWADGPNSETPPGHWNVLFNSVSDHPRTTHRFLGTGPELPRLEWDVCGYLALNGALHDAALAAWSLKWEYDSSRPITMIRYLASLGQSSDPAQPNFHPDGLPLIPGQIELVSAASSAPGQRHAHLASSLGQIAVRAWLGTPPTRTQVSGVGWILGTDWVPYQLNTFVTPAFPAYISGHSTFSRAAAEVLTHFTGSEFFPGGLASYDYPAGYTLGFEAGPSERVELQWATYYDAADQAGLSRLFGGIHIATDDLTGRRVGAKVGLDAFTQFLQLYHTAISAAPVISEQPASLTALPGDAASFSAVATASGSAAFQWQRRAAGQESWSDLPSDATHRGASTSTLTLTSVAQAMNGDAYRLVVTNATGSIMTRTATLTVPARDFSGTYFGTLSAGGRWALNVRRDNTATFIAYLPSRQSAIVTNFTVGSDGLLAANGTEANTSTTSAAFTLSGQIFLDASVTGRLGGLGETFTGAADPASGPAQPLTGLYTASALYTASGAAYAVVGASGKLVIVVTGTSLVDGAAGTLNAAGQAAALTGTHGQFAVSVSVATPTFTASLTPVGSTTPVTYVGLPDRVAPISRVVNLSVRTSTGAGAQTLIVGFVISGGGNKPLLLRGMGPSLAPMGVVNAVRDPKLQLFSSAGTSLNENDDWGGSAAMTAHFNSLGGFLPPATSRDAALYATVPGGLYSFHVTANAGPAGVALAEVYDGEALEGGPQVVNLSTRAQVGTGENILIVGFVITGNAPQTVLLRALGPSLVPAGVAEALANPRLALFRGNTLLAANDDWGGGAPLKAAFSTVGASALVSGASKDAALLVTLPPGIYTAQLSGVDATTGVALVEIFLAP